MPLGVFNPDKLNHFEVILNRASVPKGYCTYEELKRALVVARYTEAEARHLASKWMGALMYLKAEPRRVGSLREETLHCVKSVFYGGLAACDKRGTAEPIRQLAACFRDKAVAPPA